MGSLKMQVKGMSCGHCVETIENAVGEITGVRKFVVDLEKNEVSVDIEENQTSLEIISSKISEVGFEVVE
ncbi:MAG: copper chaperone CopZ [Nitrospinaceae bacterium]|nr:MAG: copper chaperone CopZ [Nitrospinaceae bacterium]